MSVDGQVTSSSAMIVIAVFTLGRASQTCSRLFAIGVNRTRMVLGVDRVLASFSSAACLSAVVTRISSYGRQARMLSSEGRSSSKTLWMVGMMTVTSSQVNVGLLGIGFDL